MSEILESVRRSMVYFCLTSLYDSLCRKFSTKLFCLFNISLFFHCTRKLSPNLHLVSSWIITRTDAKICHMSEIKDLVRFRASIGEHPDTTREAPALSRASSVVVVASPTSGREATT